MQSKRFTYLDWAKGIGIFFIMLCHIPQILDEPIMNSNSFMIFIFYVISGFLFSIKYDNVGLSSKEFIIKKLKSLGIPYLFFSILAILFNMTFMICKGGNLKLVFLNVFSMVSLKGISTLWFLPTLFVAEILFFYLCNIKRYFRVYFLFGIMVLLGIIVLINHYFNYKPIVSMLLWPCMMLEKGIIAFCFFSVSAVIFKKIFNNLSIVVYVALMVLGVVLSWFVVHISGGKLGIQLSQVNIDFNNLRYGSIPVLYFVSGFLSAFGLIGVLKYLDEKQRKLVLLKFLGENSLFIMCTHLPFHIVTAVSSIVRRFVAYDGLGIKYYFYLFITMVILLIIEYILLKSWTMLKSKLIKQNKFLYSILRFI